MSPTPHRGNLPSRYAGLHVLADDDPRWPHDVIAQTQAACDGGARVVQLRMKHATDVELLEHGHALRALTRASGVALVVNDRFDIALLCEADAVHVGQTDVPPSAIPASVRAKLAVGRSTHTLEQARAALSEPIDYLAFGPVFGTQSKATDYSARGTPALAEIVALAGALPVVAIGGINRENLPEIRSAGASGAAVISAVASVADPAEAVRTLVRAFAPLGAGDD